MGETKINRANGGPENKNTQSKVIKRFCIKRYFLSVIVL